MPSDSTAFFYRENVDSLYIIDFSDPESTIKSSIQLKSYSLPVRPMAAEVDYTNNRLILLTAFMDEPQTYSLIQVYETQNLTKIQQLDSRIYRDMTLHPDLNRVFFYNSSLSTEANLIDVYYINSNTVQSFIDYDEIITDIPFYPVQVIFTPDGNQMYILITEFLNHSVIGWNMADKVVNQFIKELPSDVRQLQINSIDRSN